MDVPYIIETSSRSVWLIGISTLTGLAFFTIQIIGKRLESMARGASPEHRIHSPENSLFAASISATLTISYSIDSTVAPILHDAFGGLATGILALWTFGLIVAAYYSTKERIRIANLVETSGVADIRIAEIKARKLSPRTFILVHFYNLASAALIIFSLMPISLQPL